MTELPKVHLITEQKHLKAWPLIRKIVTLLQNVDENLEITDLGAQIAEIMQNEFNLSFGNMDMEQSDNFKTIKLKDIMKFLENCPETVDTKIMKAISTCELCPIYLTMDNFIITNLDKFKEGNYENSVLDVNFYEALYAIIFDEKIISSRLFKKFMNFLQNKGWPVNLFRYK